MRAHSFEGKITSLLGKDKVLDVWSPLPFLKVFREAMEDVEKRMEQDNISFFFFFPFECQDNEVTTKTKANSCFGETSLQVQIWCSLLVDTGAFLRRARLQQACYLCVRTPKNHCGLKLFQFLHRMEILQEPQVSAI